MDIQKIESGSMEVAKESAYTVEALTQYVAETKITNTNHPT